MDACIHLWFGDQASIHPWMDACIHLQIRCVLFRPGRTFGKHVRGAACLVRVNARLHRRRQGLHVCGEAVA